MPLPVLQPTSDDRVSVLVPTSGEDKLMLSFLLWCVLFVLCWPLALFVLVLYPLIWLLLLPFRLIGITVSAVFELLRAIILLPARLLSGPRRI